MDTREKGSTERARVHSARAQSDYLPRRSPTQLAEDVKKKCQLSKSFSSGTSSRSCMVNNEQTTSSPPLEDHYACAMQLSDNLDDNQEMEMSNDISITVKFLDNDNKRKTYPIKLSCTLEENLKWKFILDTGAYLDQCNTYIEKELCISGRLITFNSVLHLDKLSIRHEDIKSICNRLVGYAMDNLGKGLRLDEVEANNDRLENITSNMKQRNLMFHAEILGDRLYIISRKQDQKHLIELLEGKERHGLTSKQIVADPIWNKLSYLMQLPDVLKRHCHCPGLDVNLETHQEKVFITITGPREAVNMAEEEFKSKDQHILHEKCIVHVTSKFALKELQVERLLDEHLSNKGIKCVTLQNNEGIYVIGFSNDDVKAAKREVEETIIEKAFIFMNYGQKKDMIVSYLKTKWPGHVVLYNQKSSLHHIVGVKQCVEETHKIITDMMEGKLKLENLQEETAIEREAVNTMQRDADSRHLRKQRNDSGDVNHVSEQEKQNTLYDNVVFDNVARSSVARGKKEHITQEREVHKTTTEFEKQSTKVINEEANTPLGNSQTTGGEKLKDMNDNSSSKDKMDRKCKKKITETEMKTDEGQEERKLSMTNELGTVDMKNKGKKKVTNQKQCSEHSSKPKDVQFENKVEQESNYKKNEQKIASESIDFGHEKIWKFMANHDSGTFLAGCSKKHNVTIQQTFNRDICTDGVSVTEDALIIPDEGIKHTISWQTVEKKLLKLTMKQSFEDMVDPYSRFVSVQFQENRHNKDSISLQRTDGATASVSLRVPTWIDGKSGEKKQLLYTLSEFVSQMEEAATEHVIFNLNNATNWPVKTFFNCVISKTVVGILLNSKSKSPNTISMIVSNEKMFDKAFVLADKSIREGLEDAKANRSQLQVVVMSGELNKTKADVIVNTTSRELELSYGKVSGTLLKAAGSGIQAECRKYYPNGISGKEVAVTSGHKLSCESVFHIALERYEAGKEIDILENTRSLILTCLRIASELKYKTIAFPAIGTGVLRYPVDLVASVMFESVERFKCSYRDTSLQTVFFVIYPSDVKVKEIFQRNEETLVRFPEVKRNENDSWKVRIRIRGQEKNVADAKFLVIDRCEDELHDPSEMYEGKIDKVRNTDNLALRFHYVDTIKALQDQGITIRYTNESLYLSGKRKVVKIAIEEIRNLLDKIAAYHFASISVRCYKTEAVDEQVRLVNRRNDVFCIYDRYLEIVNIHGKSPNKVSSVQKKIKKNLDDENLKLKYHSNEEASNRGQKQTSICQKMMPFQIECVEDEEKLLCVFSSYGVVQIYEGDILKLPDVDVLVCSDSRNGEGKGEVSTQLLEMSGDEYRDEKSRQFNMRHNFGDLISTSGGKSKFKEVIYAIAPKKDIKALRMMYLRIFDHAIVKKIKCIALPLLGTGTGQFKAEESASVCLEEFHRCCQEKETRSLTVHLVLKEKAIANLVKDVFRRFDTNQPIEEQKLDKNHHDKHADSLREDKTLPESTDDTDDHCVICMDTVNVPKQLKCGHTFCKECIDGYFNVKQACPTCGYVCGVILGDQPDGTLEIMKIRPSCAGYEGHKSIALTYNFPPGKQGENHPKPGSAYRSISRTGLLPDTEEGRRICSMLKVAFERRLVFTIGRSRTTGEEGVITWNDIHHKTDLRPNTQFGYPDETYLQRVREEMEIKGVTEEDIDKTFMEELKAENYRQKFSTGTSV